MSGCVCVCVCLYALRIVSPTQFCALEIVLLFDAVVRLGL